MFKYVSFFFEKLIDILDMIVVIGDAVIMLIKILASLLISIFFVFLLKVFIVDLLGVPLSIFVFFIVYFLYKSIRNKPC